jgi:riboflavin synthase
MFTGLIETTGRISAIDRGRDGARLVVETALAAHLAEGDSLSVSGVCLTVTERTSTHATFEVAPITLEVTSLGHVTVGTLVNLERAVRADDRMGGHFVLGHVDGISRIRSFEPDGDSFWLEIELPSALSPFVISKGSIAIDGISLTVAELEPDGVAVQVVPYTRAHTALAQSKPGDLVNLEVDVLGKYVARLLAVRLGGLESGMPAPSLPDELVRVLPGDRS